MTATSHREHGTYTKYVVDRCRCADCRRANRDYERERSRRTAPPYVSADPARAHVEELRAAGVGLKTVAKRSGVSHGVLSKLIYGDPARGMAPSKRVRPATLERILAVTPADIAGGAEVDATVTWAHVDRLVAAGVPKAEIGRRIGQGGHSLQLARTKVQARHARAIAQMAAELDAGTLTIVKRSRHGNRTITIPAPAPATTDVPVDVWVTRAHNRAAQRRHRAIEAGLDPDDTPILYDDADEFMLEWFPDPDDTETTASAIAICRTCPVAGDCLAANRDHPDGIFGGLTAAERAEELAA